MNPCLHYVLAFSCIYSFIADNISISMYILCVILCLFSALSRRVSALQISIIIIMETDAPEILSVVNVDIISAGGINLLLSLSHQEIHG